MKKTDHSQDTQYPVGTGPSPDRIAKGLYWDRALSLVEGCTPLSDGCDNCWSADQTHMRSCQTNQKIIDRYAGLIGINGQFNGKIRLMWDDIDKPKHVKKPLVWAVWNDLFHRDVPYEFQYKTFEMMLNCPEQTFIICTKRAWIMKHRVNNIYFHLKRNYPDHTLPLPNVILMVTAENQEMADLRIPFLFQAQAAMRGVSIEPMLGAINIKQYLQIASEGEWMNMIECGKELIKLDWVIIGEESGAKARKTEKHHIADILSQCMQDDPAADIPVFLKQMWVNGKLTKLPVFAGRKYAQFPKLLTKGGGVRYSVSLR